MEKNSVVYPNLKRDSEGKLTECILKSPGFQSLIGLNLDERPAPHNLPKINTAPKSYLTL